MIEIYVRVDKEDETFVYVYSKCEVFPWILRKRTKDPNVVQLTSITGRMNDLLDRVPAKVALFVFKEYCRDTLGHAVQSSNVNVCYRVLGLLDVPPVVFKRVRGNIWLIRQIMLNNVKPRTVFVP